MDGHSARTAHDAPVGTQTRLTEPDERPQPARSQTRAAIARARLQSEIAALPAWGTPELARRLQATEPSESVSRGALVRFTRRAHKHAPPPTTSPQQRLYLTADDLFLMLLSRISGLKQQWANAFTRRAEHVPTAETAATRDDLLQELDMRLLEAVRDGTDESWELFFRQALRYLQLDVGRRYLLQHGFRQDRSNHKRLRRVEVALSELASHTPDEDGNEHVAEFADPAEMFTAAELADLMSLVARLPYVEKAAIMLRLLEQVSDQEIARLLDVTPRSVCNYRRNGYSKLAQWYTQGGRYE